jgi:hypothetical protein
MRNIILLLSIFLLASCSAKSIKITVENPANFERNKEIVELPVAGLGADFINKTYVLKDEKGTEVGYQLLSDKKTLLFQANVAPKASVTYTLQEGKPAPVAPRAHVRFVPERSDDISWENDIVAYRMYGPALMKTEHPSNGVDIWMKYKDEPVADTLYSSELQRKITYHEDNGFGGLDCYDVNHTLGAGGVTPYTDRLWIGNAFNSYKIVESGPLRSVFTLTYDTVPVNGAYYAETLTITCDSGSPLCKGVVKFEGAGPIQVATGIFMDKDSVNTVYEKDTQIISYTKNATSRKGVSQGQTYIGVYAPDMVGKPFIENGNYAVLHNYKTGDELTYYFGGGWSKWKFPTEQDWLKALVNFTLTKQNPLKLTINNS